MKLELMTADAARGAVLRGLIYCGTRRMVHMAVGGGGASVARIENVGRASVRAPVPATGAGLGGRISGGGVARSLRTLAGNCFRCGKVGHWKNECAGLGGVDNLSSFTCGRRGHVGRDCPKRDGGVVDPAAVGFRGVAKGKERAEHGPAEGRMGPNERAWYEAKNTFFDDERVWKTMEEIEKQEGPMGAHS